MSLRHPKAPFAVIGQPIDHSLSPFIHKLFARQWTVDLDYRAIELSPDGSGRRSRHVCGGRRLWPERDPAAQAGGDCAVWLAQRTAPGARRR